MRFCQVWRPDPLKIIIAVGVILSVIAYSNCTPRAVVSNLLKQGEIWDGDLQYRLYLFGVLPVANATLRKPVTEELNGNKVYHISAAAENTKLTIPFFKGAALLDSYVDTRSLSPVLFKQFIAARGKPDSEKEVYYNQKEGVMTILGVKRSIPADTQDPLSVIFNLRRLDLAKTKDIGMCINNNQKNYILNGAVSQRELNVNKKVYALASAAAEIKRKDGNPYHKSKLEIVFLKEHNNIPILIDVFAGGILIKAKLVRIK